MTKDEALDLALEALEQIASAMPFPVGSRAITAIKQALAAPVQEPLGYLEIDDIESQREYPHNCRNVNLWHEGGQGMAAIYTTPPAQPAPALWMEMVTANLVRADERDVCAKLVDHILKEGGGTWGDAIRARGNT